MSLNAKQERFAHEFLVDLNMTDAYKRAGFKATGHAAESNASRLMKNAEVQAIIQAGRKEVAQKTLVSVEYVVTGLKEVAERCLQRVPVMVGQGKERKQAQEYTTDPETGEEVLANVWTFDSSGVCRSLELLGKHNGAFIQDDAEDLPMPISVSVNVYDGRKPA